MSRPRPPARLGCECLEARETPAVLTTPLIDSFDAGGPFAPPGWQGWATNGQPYYQTTRAAAVSGGGLAVYGTSGVESRLWNRYQVGGNVSASVAVRADLPAPIVLFARGANLVGNNETSVSAVVTNGGGVELRQTLNGADTTLATVRVPNPPAGSAGRFWLRVTLDVAGPAASVKVQRLDTGAYLSPAGTWQTAEAVAARGTTSVPAVESFAGVGRLSGTYGTAYLDEFKVTPLSVGVPQKQAHIRLAQLAYAGTPIGETETQQFRDKVDLTVTSPDLLDDLNAASATTPQLIYTNASNLYQGLLTDWLNYADRTGTDREAAFFHVAQPTAFTNQSQSAIPVKQFWDVQRITSTGSTDLTANARNGRGSTLGTGVRFGEAGGDAVAIGWPDRFREVNIDLSRNAGNGWTGVWEYAAVDATGRTVWKPLRIASDGSSGLTADGQLTFDPPADWKPVQLASTNPLAGNPLYYLRVRTLTPGTSPEAFTLYGRNFLNATDGSRPAGTIPVFDTTADANADGYLNDAEWARRQAGQDARFVHESRLIYPNYGQMRFAVNPTSQAVKAWAADYHTRILAANPLAGGLFVDNANGKLPTGGAAVKEVTSNYNAESAAVIAAITAAVAPKAVIANTSGAAAEADSITRAATGAFEEFLLRPAGANWSAVGDAANIVNRRVAATRADGSKPLLVIDSLPPSKAAMTDPRTLTATLSYYYLLADPTQTMLMFWGGYAPAAGWDTKGTPQTNFNVGRPTGAMTTLVTGKDPADTRLEYKVFARDYENALVLFKPLSYTRGVGTGTTADNTSTEVKLNGAYRVLDANGVPSAGTVTSVWLRNGEGAILVKA